MSGARCRCLETVASTVDRQVILKAYRCILTMPACVLISATALVDPSTSASELAIGRRVKHFASFISFPHLSAVFTSQFPGRRRKGLGGQGVVPPTPN